MTTLSSPVHVSGALDDRRRAVLTDDALAFLAQLHERFEPRREALLAARRARQAEYDAGRLPELKPADDDDWTVSPPPPALRKRWVEITGPTEAKMLINALNSGATGYMADFEDANAPTWANMIDGQANLIDAVAGTLTHTAPDGREYALDAKTATLLVRPRGWHLDEAHATVGGAPIAGALFDFGLFLYHNAKALLARGAGPYFYVPKLEGAAEAELWRDVFISSEDALGIPRGSIRATVLVETLPAAFEMDGILSALREHSAGLNAGRWDYIFSAIKVRRNDADAILPDRAAVTMTVPFMKAYTDLLVATCHRRGAHAMGGMAALVPSRDDLGALYRALEAVRADKTREVRAGFDGTWVAHPGLVETALEVFDSHLGGRDNQLGLQRDDVRVGTADLLDLRVPGTAVTPAGVQGNVHVALQYLTAWLGGRGAVAIDGLMEDVATAEIARTQLWQWIRHGVVVDGAPLTAERVLALAAAEAGISPGALSLFERLVARDDLPDFLTTAAA